MTVTIRYLQQGVQSLILFTFDSGESKKECEVDIINPNGVGGIEKRGEHEIISLSDSQKRNLGINKNDESKQLCLFINYKTTRPLQTQGYTLLECLYQSKLLLEKKGFKFEIHESMLSKLNEHFNFSLDFINSISAEDIIATDDYLPQIDQDDAFIKSANFYITQAKKFAISAKNNNSNGKYYLFDKAIQQLKLAENDFNTARLPVIKNIITDDEDLNQFLQFDGSVQILNEVAQFVGLDSGLNILAATPVNIDNLQRLLAGNEAKQEAQQETKQEEVNPDRLLAIKLQEEENSPEVKAERNAEYEMRMKYANSLNIYIENRNNNEKKYSGSRFGFTKETKVKSANLLVDLLSYKITPLVFFSPKNKKLLKALKQGTLDDASKEALTYANTLKPIKNKNKLMACFASGKSRRIN